MDRDWERSLREVGERVGALERHHPGSALPDGARNVLRQLRLAAGKVQVRSGDPGAYRWRDVGPAIPVCVTLVGSAADSQADREWTNMPSTTTEVFSLARHRTKLDLTHAAQARLVVQSSGGGAAGSKLWLQYSTDLSAWSDLGASAQTEAVLTATDAASAWADLAAGAKADVWVRVVGSGGNGTADPVISTVVAQFR